MHVYYRGDSDQTLPDSESESPSPGSEPLAPDLGRPGSSSRHSVIRLDRTGAHLLPKQRHGTGTY